MTEAKPERLLRLPQVRDRVPMSRATIYEWVRRDKFPKPVNLGGGMVAWRESEIERWIAERPAA